MLNGTVLTAADATPPEGWRPSDPAYRRTTFALFLAGVATFALAYAPQPLLPVLRDEFSVTPAMATLSLSATTVTLGLALLFFGPLSDAVGRVRLMQVTMLVAALIGVAPAFATSWEQVLVLRAALGVALAGLPAVATAYLREEVHHDWATSATGLYIGGTAIGGMAGRLLSGALADLLDWRWALGGIGALALAIAVALQFLLPPPRRFRPSELRPALLADNARRMVLDRGLMSLYLMGFALMGAFVAIFNAMAFRLAAPPFLLSVGVAGLVFVVNGLGSVTSPLGGRLATRYGARAVVPVALAVDLAGIALTLVDTLWAIALGLALVTSGFFAAHGVVSAWVTARASRKGPGTAMAGSLYLAFYYFGSSVMGALAGTTWSAGGWLAVAALCGGLIGFALLLAVGMRRVPEIAHPSFDVPPATAA